MPTWYLIFTTIIGILFLILAVYGVILLETIKGRLTVIEARIAVSVERLDAEDIPVGSFGALLENIRRFVYLADQGRIPSLRADDWIPSVQDRERAAKTFEERNRDDEHLGAYPGPR